MLKFQLNWLHMIKNALNFICLLIFTAWASAGDVQANDQEMIQSIHKQIAPCWKSLDENRTYPPITVLMDLREDGSLKNEPKVLTRPDGTREFSEAAWAAIKAVKDCSPLNLPPELYPKWKSISWLFQHTPTPSHVRKAQFAKLKEKAGSFQEAEKMLTSAVSEVEKKFGKNDRRLEVLFRDVAAFYERRRSYKKAEAAYIRLLKVTVSNYGESSINHAAALSSYSGYFQRQNKPKLALPIRKKAQSVFSALLGSNHEVAINQKLNVAFIHNALGQFDLSESLILSAIKSLKKPSLNMAEAHIGLANIYANRGERKRAEASLRKALDVGGRAYDKNERKNIEIRHLLARNLIETQQYSEAIAHLKEVQRQLIEKGEEQDSSWLSLVTTDLHKATSRQRQN